MNVFRGLAVLLIFVLPHAVFAATCSGTVYLTLTPGNMAQADTIARIVRQEQVKATIFLANEKTFRGDHALDAAWGDYWRALVADGHVFGNHTFRHLYFKKDLPDGRLLTTINHGGPAIHLDAAGLCADLKQVDDAFEALTGRRPAGMWRAPGKHATPRALQWAASCVWPVHVRWDDRGFVGDELASEQYPNDKLLKQALKTIGPDTIIMMHLGIQSRKDPLAPMLAPLIRGLKARGLCFATLSASWN
jgi:peptidoglycan/xylan/chitin deacetylase (PgdA/CDA1 family)